MAKTEVKEIKTAITEMKDTVISSNANPNLVARQAPKPDLTEEAQ